MEHETLSKDGSSYPEPAIVSSTDCHPGEAINVNSKDAIRAEEFNKEILNSKKNNKSENMRWSSDDKVVSSKEKPNVTSKMIYRSNSTNVLPRTLRQSSFSLLELSANTNRPSSPIQAAQRSHHLPRSLVHTAPMKHADIANNGSYSPRTSRLNSLESSSSKLLPRDISALRSTSMLDPNAVVKNHETGRGDPAILNRQGSLPAIVERNGGHSSKSPMRKSALLRMASAKSQKDLSQLKFDVQTNGSVSTEMRLAQMPARALSRQGSVPAMLKSVERPQTTLPQLNSSKMAIAETDVPVEEEVAKGDESNHLAKMDHVEAQEDDVQTFGLPDAAQLAEEISSLRKDTSTAAQILLELESARVADVFAEKVFHSCADEPEVYDGLRISHGKDSAKPPVLPSEYA